MILTYFFSSRLVSTSLARRCRLRLPVLWLFRCFLPAWLRLSLPEAVTRKRFLEPLCVFILGMVPTLSTFPRRLHRKKKGTPGARQGSRGAVYPLPVQAE